MSTDGPTKLPLSLSRGNVLVLPMVCMQRGLVAFTLILGSSRNPSWVAQSKAKRHRRQNTEMTLEEESQMWCDIPHWTPSLMARVQPPCPTILGMAAPVPLLPGEICSFASLPSPTSAGKMWHGGNDTNQEPFPQLPLSCTSAPQHHKPQCHHHPEARTAEKSQPVLLLVTTHDTKWLRTSAEATSRSCRIIPEAWEQHVR